ncbi:hypothetical protein [Pseudoruminococcus massiliensis]|uniref:hypothetical protein n=1 Tax=Pseudoruminococcus massiliensis TaxID=2086583 RepID=UPI003AB195F2
MKKTISLILSFILLISCFCLSGCQQKKLNPTPNDLVNSLKEGGYENAWYISKDMSETLPFCKDRGYCIEVYGTEKDIYISTMLEPDQQIARYGLEICNYSGSKNQEDAIKILNIIMPLFDDNFDNGGEEIINNLEELSKDKSNAREFKIADYPPSYLFSYEYHGFTFEKRTDENYNDESIQIYGTFEVYLERNNLTLEDVT